MRIGILGYGSIGSRHGQNLIGLGHKVIFHDPAMSNGLPKAEVIKHADAIIIASPTSEHASDCLLCMREKKPCLVEKPVANVWMKGVDKHLQWPLMVGYNMRFHPCILKAAEWLADERVGEPLWANFICAQYNDKPEYARDGVTLNWSHEIDMAMHLLGHGAVEAAAITNEDDIADIIFRHLVHGCQTSIHLDYVTRPEHRGFSICGPKGVMIANIPQRSIILIGSDGVIKQAEQYPGDINDDYIAEMKAFINRVEGREAIGCTAAEAIDVLKVCLQAKKMAGLT